MHPLAQNLSVSHWWKLIAWRAWQWFGGTQSDLLLLRLAKLGGCEGVRCPADASYRRGCCSSKCYSDCCASGVGKYTLNTFSSLFHLVCSLETGKNRRLKQAKEEAQAEIEQYRLQREKEFKAKEAAALGSHGSCTTEVEKETQEKMSVIQQNFQKNREVVLSQLLSLVCDIKPEIHVNYRING
ncbi:PREDICTED: V-type proton ATPase subunit G 1 [Nipponia nippon]|uniref:V-type proton ATPase subunit G 1 n=1 Tax=Nipponia nippon TaxID=128390 RepID=UPI0005107B78|nr:PREDICTED: V-type proton ATPase subunit G 1 [Nipponia nippon]